MKYKLSDICSGITDGSHNPPAGISKSDYLMLSSKNIFDDDITFEDPRYLSKEQYVVEHKRTGIKPGDILMTIVGTVGRTAIVPVGIPPITLQRSVAVLHPLKDVCLSRYLMYVLRSNRQVFESEAHGVAQKGIYLKQLSSIVVEVPEIKKQEKVVQILDQVQSIIKRRQEELIKLDNLIKARFVEMFGDRYINDRKWPTLQLGDCISFNNGKAHEQVVDEAGEYILVTSRAIASDFTDVRRTNALLFPLHKNDIVMVMSDVPNGRALAKCQLIDKDNKYTLNQRICSFDKYDFNPVFLLYLLNRHQYFLDFNDGNGQTNLRKNDILGCTLINPPMVLQGQFAEFVKQVDKSKAQVQKALDETQLLFNSLMQEYFG